LRSLGRRAWGRGLGHGAGNERRRNEPGRHVLGERDAAADRDPHRREPGAAEEAATIDAGPAAEGDRIGALPIVLVKLVDRALDLARHGGSPW